MDIETTERIIQLFEKEGIKQLAMIQEAIFGMRLSEEQELRIAKKAMECESKKLILIMLLNPSLHHKTLVYLAETNKYFWNRVINLKYLVHQVRDFDLIVMYQMQKMTEEERRKLKYLNVPKS